MTGSERAQSFGNLMAAGVLFAGGVGLFASGLAAVIGAFAAVSCLGGVCLAKVAERRAIIREEASRERQEWPVAPEAAPPAIGEEAETNFPERAWVASLATPRTGRSR